MPPFFFFFFLVIFYSGLTRHMVAAVATLRMTTPNTVDTVVWMMSCQIDDQIDRGRTNKQKMEKTISPDPHSHPL
jgi:hypothetical protein